MLLRGLAWKYASAKGGTPTLPYASAAEGASPAEGSYGGLFGLYALFRQSPASSHYLLGSPGIVTEHDAVFGVEGAQFDAGVPLAGRAYLSIGEHEQADSGTAYALLGRNYERLVALLRERAYPELAWTAEIIPGETHASVIPFALSRGIRWLFDRDGLPLAPVRTLD